LYLLFSAGRSHHTAVCLCFLGVLGKCLKLEFSVSGSFPGVVVFLRRFQELSPFSLCSGSFGSSSLCCGRSVSPSSGSVLFLCFDDKPGEQKVLIVFRGLLFLLCIFFFFPSPPRLLVSFDAHPSACPFRSRFAARFPRGSVNIPFLSFFLLSIVLCPPSSIRFFVVP